MKIKFLSLLKIFAVIFISHQALAAPPQDLTLLPLSEQVTEFKSYDLATEGTHYYSLWCGTSKNDDGYSIQYNYFVKNHPPVAVKFAGGENMAVRFYYTKDISIDSVTKSINFQGIGSLNAKLTRLKLESGVVKPCTHDLEDEAIQNEVGE